MQTVQLNSADKFHMFLNDRTVIKVDLFGKKRDKVDVAFFSKMIIQRTDGPTSTFFIK